MPLSPKEKGLANSIGFDPKVTEFVKSRVMKKLTTAIGISKSYEEVPIDGLSFRVIDGEEAERMMNKVQPFLLRNGYRAFWSRRRDGSGDEVVVLKTKDHYAIVKAQRTDGANYEVTHKAVLAKLRRWEKQCEFEVVGASQDWVALVFHKLPKNICSFAEDVYRFCPDTVEQGVGLMRESENPKLFAAARRLCPQLSAKTNAVLNKEKQKTEQLLKGDARFQALFDAFKSSPMSIDTSTEVGIKLLAHEIKTKKYLFLWWD